MSLYPTLSSHEEQQHHRHQFRSLRLHWLSISTKQVTVKVEEPHSHNIDRHLHRRLSTARHGPFATPAWHHDPTGSPSPTASSLSPSSARSRNHPHAESPLNRLPRCASTCAFRCPEASRPRTGPPRCPSIGADMGLEPAVASTAVLLSTPTWRAKDGTSAQVLTEAPEQH
jgi:hypothetical protein